MRIKPTLAVSAAALLALGGCTGHGRHTSNRLSQAQLRMNQIRSATDWEMAESAFLAGDFDRAQEKLERSILLNPRVAKSHELLGRVYLEQGELEQARASLLRATVLDPKRPEPHYFLGVLDERFRAHEAALRHYQAAVELDETNAAYALAATELLVDLGRMGEAEAFLAEREGTFSYNAGIKQTLGQLAMLRSEHELAAELFREARLLSPDDPGLHEDLSRALMASGDYAGAAHSLETLRREKGYDERRDLMRLLAACYAEVDRPTEARSLLLDVVADERGAEDAGVWQELGAIAFDLGDYRTIGRAGRRLMALAPHAPEGYVFRAAWFQHEDQPDRALEALEAGATRGALDADGLVMLGAVAGEMGDFDTARRSFALALEQDPGHELARALVMTDVPGASFSNHPAEN